MQMIRPKESIPVWNSKVSDQSEEDAEQEIESPKSVVAAASESSGNKWRKNSGECFHIQVMRLKEEESHLDVDVFEEKIIEEGLGYRRRSSGSPNDDVLKPMILPASPLSARKELRN